MDTPAQPTGTATAPTNEKAFTSPEGTALERLQRWREWAQFVYRVGGPAEGTDAELRLRVCKAHDRAVFAAKVAWQPIETAPKDGRVLLSCWRNDPQFIAWVEGEGWRVMMPPARGMGFSIHGNFVPYQPTHWMPLPAPPTLGGNSTDG